MHISDGVLPPPVLIAGATVAALGTAWGLKCMPPENVPKVALGSAGFFVASLVHLPLGFTSAHFLLNGLVGVLLGWSAFPAILIALVLQLLLWGFGGILTLGVNTVTMALPAVVAWYFIRAWVRVFSRRYLFFAGMTAGAMGVLGAALVTVAVLLTAGREFISVAVLILSAHLPTLFVEMFVTGFAVHFVCRVSPATLNIPAKPEGGLESTLEVPAKGNAS